MASFFEQQDHARGKTRQLIGWFLLALVAVVLSVDAAIFATKVFTTPRTGATHNPVLLLEQFTQWSLGPAGLITAGGTLLVILGGSLFRMWQLSASADRVAIMMGGRRVDPCSGDPHEKQLINVVEEMAIASGVKVPRLYLLDDEQGINAFAAGLSPNDAAIAVTRGALDSFTRDELQGVIAHEFSHILNSDMRLNLHLIGLLAGILLIGRIGQNLIEGTSSRSSRSRNDLALLGVALMLIGMIGTLCGSLIKAAVSRQREFLADASAVQFTRLPAGIGSALLKIRDGVNGSRLRSPHAQDVSHMCFGESVRSFWGDWMATHPPLDERINAIAPFLLKESDQPAPAAPSTQAAQAPVAGISAPTTASALIASVGQLDALHISTGAQLHASLPGRLMQAAHAANEAPLLFCAMLMATPQQPGSTLAPCSDLTEQEQAIARELSHDVEACTPQQRLPLTQVLMSTLQTLDEPTRQKVLANARQVIEADGRTSLSECALYLLAEKYLLGPARQQRQINSLAKVGDELAIVLVAMSRASGQPPEVRDAALAQAFNLLGITAPAPQRFSSNALSVAMRRLACLSPLLKQPVLQTATDLVLHDGTLTLTEFELIRTLCELLEAPMPPAILDGSD